MVARKIYNSHPVVNHQGLDKVIDKPKRQAIKRTATAKRRENSKVDTDTLEKMRNLPRTLSVATHDQDCWGSL